MDTLMVALNQIMHTQVVGKLNIFHFLMVACGTLFPIVIGLVLPRKKTIRYGMLINKTIGLALLQRRIFKSIPTNILSSIVAAVQTTFQDVSFGVYLDARKDLTAEEKTAKIQEYLQQVPAVKSEEEVKKEDPKKE